MKTRQHIKYNDLLLILLYLFSNSHTILLHNHTLEQVTYERANACVKSIYYTESVKNFKHNTHISKSTETCLLCYNHTASAHSFQQLYIFNIKKTLSEDYSFLVKNIFFQKHSNTNYLYEIFQNIFFL